MARDPSLEDAFIMIRDLCSFILSQITLYRGFNFEQDSSRSRLTSLTDTLSKLGIFIVVQEGFHLSLYEGEPS